MVKIESDEQLHAAEEELWELMNMENQTEEEEKKMEQLAIAIDRYEDGI